VDGSCGCCCCVGACVVATADWSNSWAIEGGNPATALAAACAAAAVDVVALPPVAEAIIEFKYCWKKFHMGMGIYFCKIAHHFYFYQLAFSKKLNIY
jgi:hypothetical protein